MTMPGGGGDSTRTANVVLDAQVQPYQQAMQQSAASTNSFSDAVDKLDAKLSSLSKRASKKLLQFSASDFAALGGATATAATFEKQLGTLNATAAVTGQSMGGIKGAVESAFVKFPVARTSVVQLTEAISSLGVTGARDLSSLTQTFIKLGAATGEPMADLAQGLTQLSRLMGTTGSGQIANYANSLLTVSKNAGVSATGVLSFAQSIAPLARQAGIGEASVLGISAAFSKAGADGYVAANTFNSIVGDITNLTQSGSPELAKYANLIGKTVSQFKSMDKTTAITEIFQNISAEGPKAIQTLNQLGIDGTRAQSAIAGVVQSGNLQQSISQAVGSSHDTNNLNAGSKAAFAGLADSLTSLRNNFTQFGTEIGTTFLKPLDSAVTTVNRLFSAINQLIKPFAPLIALLAGTAGVIGAVGGAALGAAGVIGAGALFATAKNSGPGRALREGVGFGRTGTANASSGMFEGGGTGGPLRAQIPYLMGRSIGGVVGPPGAPGSDPSLRAQAARGFIRAPFRATAGYLNQTSGFLSNARRDDYDRDPYQGGAGGTGGSAGASSGSMRQRIGAAASAAKEENALNTARMGSTRAVIKESGNLAVAFGRLTAETAKTGLSLIPGKVGTAASGISRAGSAATSALFSPLGIIGATAGMYAFNKFQSSQAAGHDQDTASLNPITKYNDALGIATTNLASFAAAVNTAATGTNNLNGVTSGTSFKSVATDTGADIQAVQGQKSSDSTISALAKTKGGKTNTAALSQLAQSYNLTDPRQLQMFKNNANAAGFNQDTVTAALQSVVATQGGTGTNTNPMAIGNYSAVGQAYTGTQAQVHGFAKILGGTDVINNESDSGKKLANSILSGIGTTANDNQQYGQQFAAQKKFADQLSLFGSIADGFNGKVSGGKDNVQNIKRKALANTLSTTYQGSQDTYLKKLDQIDFSGMTDEQRQQAIVGVIGSTTEGANQLGTLNVKGQKTTTNVAQMPAALKALFGSGTTNATTTALNNLGASGKFATTNSTVNNAIANQGDANAQYAGAKALADQFTKTGGSVSAATDGLNKMTGIIKDVNNPLYQMAVTAKAIVAQQQAFLLPQQSRASQAQASVNTYATAQSDYARSAAANGGTASPDASATLQTAQSGYQQQKEQDRQFLIGIYQQAQSYGTQMERAQEDQDTTILRNHRDFLTQMTQSEQDYQKSTYRSQRDFGIQMERQAQSSAESIYDPYTRVSAKYTADAGTLLQNLDDQNQRIAQQSAQLDQIKKLGITQKSIDTLQLADPNNAQQLNNLVGSLLQNPSLVTSINKAVATRIQGTTALTQSNFNEAFRNTVADFQKGLNDASNDYQTAHDRAVKSQNIALGDMAADYQKMVKRSGQDLATAMTEIYGSYADIFGKTMGEVTNQIGKYAPQAAEIIQKQLDGLKLPSFMDPNYSGTAAALTGMGSSNAAEHNQNGYTGNLGHAKGGISTKAHMAAFSEGNKPEAIIPLDARGAQFMAGFAQQVSMAAIKQMGVSQHPSMPSGLGGGATSFDMSTQFTGPITITANNTKDIIAQLQAQARIKKLRTPPRSTAGSTIS